MRAIAYFIIPCTCLTSSRHCVAIAAGVVIPFSAMGFGLIYFRRWSDRQNPSPSLFTDEGGISFHIFRGRALIWREGSYRERVQERNRSAPCCHTQRRRQSRQRQGNAADP